MTKPRYGENEPTGPSPLDPPNLPPNLVRNPVYRVSENSQSDKPKAKIKYTAVHYFWLVVIAAVLAPGIIWLWRLALGVL